MYFLLFGVFASVGLLAAARPKAGLVLFAGILLGLPNSTAYDKFDYFGGIYAYDAFFLALGASRLIVLPFRTLRRTELVEWMGLTMLFCIVMAVWLVGEGAADKYLLRDLRLFLVVAEGLLLFGVATRCESYLEPNSLFLLAIISAAGALLGFWLLWVGVLEAPDLFYEENRFRYFGIGSYFCLALLLCLIAEPRRFVLSGVNVLPWIVLLALATIVLAGVRMLVVSLLVGGTVGMRLELRRVLLYAGAASLGVASFVFVSVALGIERVTDAFSFQGVLVQLAVRFGPAIGIADQMTASEWFFGSGLGTTFEIPWFDYRGLDVRNNFVDSAFITLGIKLGALSLGYAWIYCRSIGVGRLSPASQRALLLGVAVMATTMAVPYQKFAIALPLLASLWYAMGPSTSRLGGVGAGGAHPQKAL